MPNKANPEHFRVLEDVTTVKEAANMTGYHPQTIRYNIDAGNIAAVQVGKTWLISVPSLKALYPPQKLLLHD